MWNKIYKWTLGLLILLAVGGGIYFATYIMMDTTDNSKSAQAENDDDNEEEGETFSPKNVEEDEKEVKELSEEKFEESTDNENLNPFGDQELAENVDEKLVQDYIHQMSHQKVRAEEKWGFYRITEERINWVIEVVKANNYNHGDQYLDILNQWKEGNFSNIDVHHNIIWELQGGNVGRATGVLSEEEEKAYIESAE
ncbi:hypothetical protein CEY16_11735 [Halalkalibacillus sediminis]|uniref:CTP synthase n=1 Tax=Halalkalibacillus sediminis TaxID=2018042 RepID=A0A2I0QSV8_9BACI|nr:DUF6241 domain-containing protein [Halalkalibacillus sediminis]PKR77394.1 hypothetical protein CEY16_11735 [Halalkalibacillus sediminis]